MGVVRVTGDVTIELGELGELGARDAWELTLADAGNPHAITTRPATRAVIDAVGPRIATHSRFPAGTNVEFAVYRKGAIDLVVWERGVGVTHACGTGACATVAVGVVSRRRRRRRRDDRESARRATLRDDPRGRSRHHARSGAPRLLRGRRMRDRPLRVLIMIDDEDVAQAVEHVIREEGDAFERATSIDAAVASATAVPVDVAFIDLGSDGGAALALCHHLPSICPGVAVHALVSPSQLERGAEALSLGAAGVIVSPPTGDALARALADVKAEEVRSKQVNLLEEKLGRERKKLETYDRLVRFARGAAQSDAVRAIVDGVSQISGARGVALYATFGDAESERVRLAAVGSALDLPAMSQPADLSRLVQARHARVVPLVTGGGELGILVLENVPASSESEIASVADLAAAMLSLVDRHDQVDESVRVFPPRHFRTVADRMLTLASRHDRRASVLAITLPGPDRPNRREEATLEIADIVRNTDALCGTEDGDLLVFLPETTGIGAHACRRRILARLMGERRARPKGNLVRSRRAAQQGACALRSASRRSRTTARR